MNTTAFDDLMTPSSIPSFVLPSVNFLLQTKFHVPTAHSSLVWRNRLLERLDGAKTSRLTLLSAPAGFGKTTLLAQWVEAHPGEVAWLSLDGSDNDPVRFWRYLGSALEGLEPGCGLRLEDVFQLPPVEQLVIGLINNFAEVRRDVYVVLDDYHLIENPLIHSALTLLLDYLPPRLHLILSSRVDPPLPLSRLRVRRQLTEIRAADLRFHFGEAEAFFHSTMGLELTEAQLQTLEERTEGWIAALQLAALGLQSQGDNSAFVQAFKGNHRYVVDYLMEEVLQHQPRAVQDFLLRTSILERLNARLVEKLTGCTDGQAMLQSLEHLNMFLVPLDQECGWYRYHHLFGQYLQAQLAHKYGSEVAELHRQAARWYIEQNANGEAITHLLAAGDYEGAADLIERNYFPMVASSQLTTYLNWILALPLAYRQTRPVICVAAAWLYWFQNDFETTNQYLTYIEEFVAAKPGVYSIQEHSWLSETGCLRARLLVEKQEFEQARTLCDETLAQTAPPHTLARGLLLQLRGQIYKSLGQNGVAQTAIAEAVRLARADHNMLLTLSGLSELVELQSANGQLPATAETNRQAIQLATTPDGRALPGASVGYAGLGRVLVEWNETERAIEHFERAIALGKPGGLINHVFQAQLGLALAYQSRNEFQAANESLHAAAQLIRPGISRDMQDRLEAYQARLRLGQGALEAARSWAEEAAPRLLQKLNPDFDFEYFTLVRVWLGLARQEGDQLSLKKAQSFLQNILETSRAGGQTGRVIEALTLQSLAYELEGASDRALEGLETALGLAQPEGYVRLFLNEGLPMAGLLAKLEQTSQNQPEGLTHYIQKLLTGPGGPSLPGTITPALASGSSPVPTLAPAPAVAVEKAKGALALGNGEILTPREFEVLQLMSTGASNQAISDQLVISLHTTKIHVGRILAKLEVDSRTGAVAAANKLGIL